MTILILQGASSFPMSSVSLASLPPDIVRKLIRSNPPETWAQLRLISQTWNVLVVEAFNARPPIKRVFMGFDQKKIMLVRLELDPTYAEYFSKILADVPGLELEQKPDQYVLRFDMSWTDSDSLMLFLTRIFASSSNVDTFHCASFNENALHFIGKTMRNVRIGRIKADFNLWGEGMRKATLEIIKRNKVYNIQMKAVKFNKEDMCEALQSFSQYVSIIGVNDWNYTSDTAFGYNTNQYWCLFMQELIDKNDLKMFTLLNERFSGRMSQILNQTRVCDPFFEFMHQFEAYFRC